MTFANIASAYLQHNILLGIAFIAIGILGILNRKKFFHLPYQEELRLNYFAISALIALVLIGFVLPAQEAEGTFKIWQTSVESKSLRSAAESGVGEALVLPFGQKSYPINLSVVEYLFVGVLALWAVGVVRILAQCLHLIISLRRYGFVLRKVGKTEILLVSNLGVPFSIWLPGRALVVVPMSYVGQPELLRMIIAHELQHHRQGDTKWIFLFGLIKLLCLWNPAIHLWQRRLDEIQEYACDEALVDHKKVNSRDYARCLFEVAQTALLSPNTSVRATAVLKPMASTNLKRRINMMLSQDQQGRRNKWTKLAAGSGLIAVLLGGSFASSKAVQDRRVTPEQAQEWANKAASKADYPIVMNELVLEQLRFYVGTPEGRRRMQSALEKMETYRSAIEKRIEHYGLPNELLAIPIIESGYENLPENNKHGWGAGLWMFIKSTARAYGLRVDDSVDERMNTDLLTDAAMRYLKSNRLRFQNWHLAVLAYNMGESNVQKAIDKAGTRHAFELVRQGYQNDRGYLAKVVAAMIIFHNPEVVK